MDTVRDSRTSLRQRAIPKSTLEVYENARISIDGLGQEGKPRRLGGESTDYVRRVTLTLREGPTGEFKIYQGKLEIYQRERFIDRYENKRKEDEHRQKRLRRLLKLLSERDFRGPLVVRTEPRHVENWPADFGSVYDAIFNDSAVEFKFLGLKEGSNSNHFVLHLLAYRKNPTTEDPYASDKSALVTITADSANPVPAETVQAPLDLRRS
jgi:hypothetical protein